MSAATKRKHVQREVREEYPLPEKGDQVVRVVSGRGNNLHEVEDCLGHSFLVSMPTKFRRSVWIKRGSFLLVSPIDEGDKVKAEICAVLTPHSIAHIAHCGLWPAAFATDAAASADQTRAGPNAAYRLDQDIMPPSESDEEDEEGEEEDEDEEEEDEDEEDEEEQQTPVNPNHRRGIFSDVSQSGK